jgi:hypothetical protein
MLHPWTTTKGTKPRSLGTLWLVADYEAGVVIGEHSIVAPPRQARTGSVMIKREQVRFVESDDETLSFICFILDSFDSQHCIPLKG